MSRSIDRTISILDFLASELEAASLSDIADATGLDKSTAHRFLRAFEEHRLVHRNSQTLRYSLGTRIMEWGGRALESVDLRAIADPILRQLNQATEETVVLYMREGQYRIAVVVYDSPKEILVSRRLGSIAPLVVGASGKVMLAFLPVDFREALLQQSPELDDEMRSRVRSEIPLIQAQGYAFSTKEIVDHAWAIAAPILDRQQQPVASIGFASPINRHSEETQSRFISLIVPAAREISNALGSRGVAPTGTHDGNQGVDTPVTIRGHFRPALESGGKEVH